MTYLLEATKIITKEMPDSVLALGGSGFDEIRPIVERLGIDRNVVYTGTRPFRELPQFYRMCDAVVGASLSEGFGLTFAEGSACGRPVVATTAGSLPEVIANGKSGLLVEPRNPQALADAVIKVLGNEELANRMGKNGAKYIRKKFDWDESARQFVKVYEKVI